MNNILTLTGVTAADMSWTLGAQKTAHSAHPVAAANAAAAPRKRRAAAGTAVASVRGFNFRI